VADPEDEEGLEVEVAVDEVVEEASNEVSQTKWRSEAIRYSIDPDKQRTGASKELSYARLAGSLGVCGDKTRQTRMSRKRLCTGDFL